VAGNKRLQLGELIFRREPQQLLVPLQQRRQWDLSVVEVVQQDLDLDTNTSSASTAADSILD
jgi:hypothetical protein